MRIKIRTIKKLRVFRGINKTAILVSLILVLPVLFYTYQNFSYKNKAILEKQEEKKRNQEVFDTCIYRAEFTFKDGFRNDCWFYNHDATGCDLSYFETYKLGDTPLTKYKKDVLACEDKFPASNRLYHFTSPEETSLLDHPLGNFTEREAVTKVIGQEKIMRIVKFPIEEGYKLSYSVEPPTKDKLFWVVHLFYESSGSEDIATIKYWRIDAISGDVSEESVPL